MNISIFELLTIGIGPSSSHTVGPMRAAKTFVDDLQSLLSQVVSIRVELYGSLALTGGGHGTAPAILNGLEGQTPEDVQPEMVPLRAQQIIDQQIIQLKGEHPIAFDMAHDFLFHYNETLPQHPNGMRFSAFNAGGQLLKTADIFSIGGGFIVKSDAFNQPLAEEKTVPYPFATARELLAHCKQHSLNISDIMLANECVWRSKAEVKHHLLHIADVMKHCIERGCTATETYLPGSLHVKRRAPSLYAKLSKDGTQKIQDMMNWVNLYALAVNEENAAGGRVVTAPTNGAAGIIPAVLSYYIHFCENATDDGIIRYLLTAGAIAILYKKGASISAAEVGCQGEVGVACSMAAGALAEILGGTPNQVENAAEIGMEHNLGLTCDPIAGLVQIPCIERNTMGSIQAINAAQLALMGDGEHLVSLDKVIATMLQTGRDMQTSYKETAKGGLAVNHPEC
jgi:L-serine dehydratase